MEKNVPFFSVVIPSRNRPSLLASAVASVMDQEFDDLEVVVVDDGSSPAIQIANLGLDESAASRVRIVNLGYQPRGRGPGYARNVGVWASSGQYCAFLDDDDSWEARDHLANAHSAITASKERVDLYLSNQTAHFLDNREPQALWLYPLVTRFAAEGRSLINGCYEVDVDDLVSAKAFNHLNTVIVSRAIFDQVQGLDEYIAYEEDMDFYFRAIATAVKILLTPQLVARHNVPDRKKRDNASTAIAYSRKMNIRLFLLGKIIISTPNESIARYCNSYAADTLKHMAQRCADQTEFRVARNFAFQALGRKFTTKWLGYSLYLAVQAGLHGGKALDR